MPAFREVYTQRQRDAMASAYVDRGLTAKEVVELARSGQLAHDGVTLEPFEAMSSSVASYGRILRRRRQGRVSSKAAELPAADAREALRRRLVAMADSELTSLERQRPGKRDPERIRQVARAVREIVAIAGPREPRPPAPGQKVDGKRTGAQTKGGLAGAILKSARSGTSASAAHAHEASPVPDDTQHGSRARENGTAPYDGAPDTGADSPDGGRPGASERALDGLEP